MNIDPRAMIAGQPALRIRSLLRQADESSWGAAFVAEKLAIKLKAAQSVIQTLYQLGYIEPDPGYDDGPWWKTTLQGNALALASATRPFKRATAERELTAFLARVQQVNANHDYLYQVRKVLLFDSMLTDADRVGDVDVAVEFVHRFANPDRRQQVYQERIKAALQAGRQFNARFEQAVWPQHEVILFLKSRSRVISVHDADDPILSMVPTRVVFEDPRPTHEEG